MDNKIPDTCTQCGKKFTRVARRMVMAHPNFSGEMDYLCAKCVGKNERNTEDRLRGLKH